MTRTAGAQIGCQRPSRFWGLGCPKIYHEAEDTLEDTQGDTDGEHHFEADDQGMLIPMPLGGCRKSPFLNVTVEGNLDPYVEPLLFSRVDRPLLAFTLTEPDVRISRIRLFRAGHPD